MTADASDFIPRWASPPGRSISTAMIKRSMTTEDLAEGLDLNLVSTQKLLKGDLQVDEILATKLSTVIGSTPGFWSRRFKQYDEDLARVAADQWARSAPADLSSLGWIPRTGDWVERIDALLEFFAVPNVAAWHETYAPILQETRYRTSPSVEPNDVAVAAWLRRAQMQASTIPTQSFDVSHFVSSMPKVRRLTWLKEPAVFLPRLTQICQDSGVAVTLVRAPKGCPASGATYRTETGAPLIVLSARFLTDDHLWFTFFHEAAHVVLHGDKTIHVDALDPASIALAHGGDEGEANDWAGRQIVPLDISKNAPRSLTTYRQVHELARKCGVAPGLIVGHYQHAGAVAFDYLNKVKRRYKWSGPSLETT